MNFTYIRRNTYLGWKMLWNN